MTWDEIAPDLSAWTIPASRAKNGVAHLVPLSTQAQAILRLRHAARASANPSLVFPGLRGPFSGYSKAKEALDEEMRRQGMALA